MAVIVKFYIKARWGVEGGRTYRETDRHMTPDEAYRELSSWEDLDGDVELTLCADARQWWR